VSMTLTAVRSFGYSLSIHSSRATGRLQVGIAILKFYECWDIPATTQQTPLRQKLVRPDPVCQGLVVDQLVDSVGYW